jgi:hypothetical protein
LKLLAEGGCNARGVGVLAPVATATESTKWFLNEKSDSHPSGTMQRRSFSHKRVDSFHSFTTPKTKSAPIKNEWGENFIMDRYNKAKTFI